MSVYDLLNYLPLPASHHQEGQEEVCQTVITALVTTRENKVQRRRRIINTDALAPHRHRSGALGTRPLRAREEIDRPNRGSGERATGSARTTQTRNDTTRRHDTTRDDASATSNQKWVHHHDTTPQDTHDNTHNSYNTQARRASSEEEEDETQMKRFEEESREGRRTGLTSHRGTC